ncbi:MAG: helix-turn-helix transcriptional regulator, partial [Lachnospiraceae bacterium]
MTVGEKIKKCRLEKNLSQKQLAIRSGMSEPAIRNYELGNRTPSDKQIEKIALALDVSPFALSEPNLDSY